jgi:enterochelin esterase-like enzyme
MAAFSAQAQVSPRLAALEKDVSLHVTGAVENFWSEVQQQGTPIVESINDDNLNVLVTYLWRGRSDDGRVVVLGDGTPGDPTNNQLALIPGTNVWYRSYRYRKDARFNYSLSPNDALTPLANLPPSEIAKRFSTVQSDPLNPHRSAGPSPMSIVSLPDAPPQPWIVKHNSVAAGTVTELKLQSKILANERSIWIYTPPNVSKTAAPPDLLVLLDGESYVRSGAPAPTILDNLIAEKRLRPVVAVGVGNLPGKRTVELTCNERFAEFLAQELVPFVRERYWVTGEARHTAIGGSSFGGLAAAFAALRFPGVFGNAIAQSGSFWWKPADESQFEWVARKYAESPYRDIRFYVEVGLMENSRFPDGRPTQLAANRHLRDVLRSRGYRVSYSEFNGDHSMLNWQGSLATALIELFPASSPPTPVR